MLMCVCCPFHVCYFHLQFLPLRVLGSCPCSFSNLVLQPTATAKNYWLQRRRMEVVAGAVTTVWPATATCYCYGLQLRVAAAGAFYIPFFPSIARDQNYMCHGYFSLGYRWGCQLLATAASCYLGQLPDCCLRYVCCLFGSLLLWLLSGCKQQPTGTSAALFFLCCLFVKKSSSMQGLFLQIPTTLFFIKLHS